MATQSEKTAFINKVFAQAKLVNTHGLFMSVLLAQAALESGWGKSTLASKYNNLFGVKAGSNWSGETVSLNTKEIINGSSQNVTAKFRVYPSWRASIQDRCNLLKSLSRYKLALNAQTADEQARLLQAAGYATATNYAQSIINTMQSNNLYEFDIKKKEI